MNKMELPNKMKSWIENKPFVEDDIGMSGNQVLIFDDVVLKIENHSERMEKQVQIMRWLEGKLPVPKVIEYEELNGKSYLLMSRIEGEMSCDTYYLERPEVLLQALANGLRMFWNMEIQECPQIRDLDTVLTEARIRVENGLADVENPKQLLEWLECNKPDFEPVFSHGDFCLPNVFLKNGQITGFIDLDKAGVCDKWNDIAICYRSLKHNFDGMYGGKVYEDFDPEQLFDVLGIEPDWEKIKYFLLLDEL